MTKLGKNKEEMSERVGERGEEGGGVETGGNKEKTSFVVFAFARKTAMF